MAARECENCGRRFPSAISATSCVFCGDDKKLTYVAGGAADVTSDEYSLQLYIKGRKLPKDLNAEELIRLEREWSELDHELARRGTSHWSHADLIGEGFPGSVRPV